MTVNRNTTRSTCHQSVDEGIDWIRYQMLCELAQYDENRDSPKRDMVNPPSEDSYMWPIRGAH